MKPWLRTGLVAAGGGALSALCAALLDPQGFSVKYRLGEGKLALMLLEGAAVAVFTLFLEPPRAQHIKTKQPTSIKERQHG